MGTIVGTVFFQSTGNDRNVFSVLFQTLFYIAISAMVLLKRQFPARSIFYKHQDANFFPTFAYTFSRSIATVPVALIDAVIYGTMVYFLVGLAHKDGASIANYFVFMLLLFIASLTSGLVFSIFSSTVKVVATAQALMSILAMLLNLFRCELKVFMAAFPFLD